MHYVNYREDTSEILGLYDDTVHDLIPQPSIPITDEVWMAIFTGNKNYCVVDGQIEEYEIPVTEPTLDEQIFEVQTDYEKKFDNLKEAYFSAELVNNTDTMADIQDEYNVLLIDFTNLVSSMRGETMRRNYSAGKKSYCPLCGTLLVDGICTNCKWKKF